MLTAARASKTTTDRTDRVRKVLATALAAAALTGIAGAVPAHAADTTPTPAQANTGTLTRVKVASEVKEVPTGRFFKQGESLFVNPGSGFAYYGGDTANGITASFGTGSYGLRELKYEDLSSEEYRFAPKYDANAKLPTAPVGAVIGRVGDSAWFRVGLQAPAPAPGTGELVLAHNDVDTLRGDNSGSYESIVYGGSAAPVVKDSVAKVIDDGRYQVALAGAGVSLAAGGGCDAGAEAKPTVTTFDAGYASRRWNVNTGTDGYVTINNDCMAPGKLVATNDGKISVAPNTADLGRHGQWAIEHTTDRKGYTLRNRATGQILSAPATGIPAPGTTVGLTERTQTTNTAWTFTKVL